MPPETAVRMIQCRMTAPMTYANTTNITHPFLSMTLCRLASPGQSDHYGANHRRRTT
jgi:hypothetical protein